MKKLNIALFPTFVLIYLLISVPQLLHSQTLSVSDKTSILAVLHNQEIKWNEGDILGYMDGYNRSDSLKFITKKGVVYGWKSTLQKYQKSYPDKAAMGHLQFDVISTEALSENKAIMIGKWTLLISNSSDIKNEVEGYFTLIWQKIDGKWLIIIDHTS